MAEKWMQNAVKPGRKGAFRAWALAHGYKTKDGQPDTRAAAEAVESGKVKASTHVKRMANLALVFMRANQ